MITILSTALATNSASSEELKWLIDSWIGRLDLLSTAMSAFFTIVAIILGFLTWKQFQLKNEAEREVRSIRKLGQEAAELYGDYSKAYDAMQNYTIAAEKLLSGVIKKSKREFNKLTNEVNKRGDAVRGLDEKIKKAHQFLDRASQSLTTISSNAPTTTTTTSTSSSSSGSLRNEAITRALEKRIKDLESV